MKVQISIDMEGVAGVAHGADTTVGAPHYDYCCRLMTAECNAAIEGCFEAGATEVLVNDSHGTHMNLLQDELDERARVVRGRTKSLGMAYGIDARTDATMFIGYHARSGGGDGVLNHTMRSRDVMDVFLNDEPAGELRLNAALAGAQGVPVALVSGDDVLCAEARECLGEVEAVEVKQAIDRYTALSLHPKVAQRRIREGAQRALGRLQDFAPYRVESPTTLRVSWGSTSTAALCANIPGTRRVSSREVEYTSNDYAELYRLLRVYLALGAAALGVAYTYD
ncbi:MAG TPA: M55 family metallopeptidase [Acidimicrobiales bacterium]|nr:M55 family metallopeptidase [Acidimicrobiales bacterium]